MSLGFYSLVDGKEAPGFTGKLDEEENINIYIHLSMETNTFTLKHSHNMSSHTIKMEGD